MSGRLIRVMATAFTAVCLQCFATGAASAAAGATTLTGHWTFDEGSGTTAADSVSPGQPLTLENGAAWAPGTVGPYALSLNGTGDQYAQSSGPVVDTAHSFTVSAWVYLDNTNGYQTFVSQDGVPADEQDGTDISGFFLQLRGDTHQFSFTLPAYDSTAALPLACRAT